MKVMGIETSCDETAVAIVDDGKRILSHIVLSQHEHEIYGGVVPEVAARAHLHHMDHLVEKALAAADCTFDDLDGMAVTAGPGLIGGVLVGVMTAKAIAAVRDIPVVAVNHLEGHALTVRLTDDVAFPYLLLLVSGGHAQILVVEDVGRYRCLGGTIDDAVGEAFDKTAKMLGLGYPGGPAVEKYAALVADPAAAMKKINLPRPLYGTAGCDFSFSGLKTAVKRVVDSFPAGEVSRDDAAALCYVFQKNVADILCDRVKNAMAMAADTLVTALVVAGGVAANKTICAALRDVAATAHTGFAAPPLSLCTDNAAMIAWAGLERLQRGLRDDIYFPVHARWPLDPAGHVAKGRR